MKQNGRKAMGSVWKNKAGRWSAKVEVGVPGPLVCVETTGHKRMKDAMAVCADASERMHWDVQEWNG
jgi:hypothetical protein